MPGAALPTRKSGRGGGANAFGASAGWRGGRMSDLSAYSMEPRVAHVGRAQAVEAEESDAAAGVAERPDGASCSQAVDPQNIVYACSARPMPDGQTTRRGDGRRSTGVAKPFFFKDKEGRETVTATICIDSGATVSIVSAHWITEDLEVMGRSNRAAVAWGDGSQSAVVAKGRVVFWVDNVRFRIAAWGVRQVTKAFISERQLVDGGAGIVHYDDGYFLDMAPMGGRRLPISDDSLLTVQVAVDAGQDARARAAAVATSAATVAAGVAQRAIAAATAAALAADVAVGHSAGDSPWRG